MFRELSGSFAVVTLATQGKIIGKTAAEGKSRELHHSQVAWPFFPFCNMASKCSNIPRQDTSPTFFREVGRRERGREVGRFEKLCKLLPHRPLALRPFPDVDTPISCRSSAHLMHSLA